MRDQLNNVTAEEIEQPEESLEEESAWEEEHLSEDTLAFHLRLVRKYPMLKADEEYELAKKWQTQRDRRAFEKLLQSHLRLVVKIASGYQGYGLPLSDLISEGTLGLMQGIEKFDPEKGFRLSTYAMWWIRAQIKEYILKTWSLVKLGTTNAQKKLFFNLNKLKAQYQLLEDTALSQDQITQLSKDLDVSVATLQEMEQRLSGPDYSLNAPFSNDSENGEWQDWLEDEREDQETVLLQNDDQQKKQTLLKEALANLSQREYEIFQGRYLKEPPDPLKDLADILGISRERVRQLESRAFEKVQKIIRQKAAEMHL